MITPRQNDITCPAYILVHCKSLVFSWHDHLGIRLCFSLGGVEADVG